MDLATRSEMACRSTTNIPEFLRVPAATSSKASTTGALRPGLRALARLRRRYWAVR
jgi:hypothetical protein